MAGMCGTYLGTQLVVQYRKYRLQRKRLARNRNQQPGSRAFSRVRARIGWAGSLIAGVPGRATQALEGSLRRFLERLLKPVVIDPLAAYLRADLVELQRLKKVVKTLRSDVCALAADVSATRVALLENGDESAAILADLSGRQATLFEKSDESAATLADLSGRQAALLEKSDESAATLADLSGRQATLLEKSDESAATLADLSGRQAALLQKAGALEAALVELSQKQEQLHRLEISEDVQMRYLDKHLHRLSQLVVRRMWPGWPEMADDEAFYALARDIMGEGRTLLGLDRLLILWQAVRNVHPLGLPGAEVGCYRGGGTYFLAGAFRSMRGSEVEFHAFDTFEGHPPGMVSEHDRFHKAGMFADVSYEDVCRYLSRYRKLTLHRGEFGESAKHLAERRFGLVHIDTDLYRSTLCALEFFGPRVCAGGIIVVDDYGAPKCGGVAEAVRGYLRHRSDYVSWSLPSEQAILVKVNGPAPA
jgi:hypothetical protein